MVTACSHRVTSASTLLLASELRSTAMLPRASGAGLLCWSTPSCCGEDYNSQNTAELSQPCCPELQVLVFPVICQLLRKRGWSQGPLTLPVRIDPALHLYSQRRPPLNSLLTCVCECIFCSINCLQVFPYVGCICFFYGSKTPLCDLVYFIKSCCACYFFIRKPIISINEW